VSTVSTAQETIRPPEPPGFLTWVKQNLFNNWYNSLLSIVTLVLIGWAAVGMFRWVFLQADWRPVTSSPLLYLVGQYPRAELWRLGGGILITSFILGVSWRFLGGIMRVFTMTYALFLIAVAVWPSQSQTLTIGMRLGLVANLGIILLGYLSGGFNFIKSRYILAAWVVDLIISLILMRGLSSVETLPVVPTSQWGGLLVTLILAVGGITLSFPIGVMLALGRRSSLPVVSIFSTAFIEVIRGVPLIGLLFLSSLILPLFLPPDIRIDRLLRALIGMTIFSAAYMAENVRGGLAAVPNGQVEAAKAVGLNSFQITTLIVLPQALRAVIPPIVGQFISLFKDTTLASGVAVLEFLSVGRSIIQANPEYIGLQMEVYLFIAAVFWVFSYMMSYASQRLEVALGVGER
jgi:general L-amino acid transport system permease protein